MTDRSEREHSLATATTSAVVAMVSFQVGASFAKQLIPTIGAPGTTAVRLGLSALLVGILQRPWRSPPTRSAWPIVLAYGLALGAMNLVFYMALRTIPLGIAVALEFTGPLGVALWHSHRRLDKLWVLLAALGLLVLLPIRRTGDALDPVGVGFALAAGVGWACYIVFGQKAGKAHGPAAATWGMIIAALIVVPFGLAVTDGPLLTRSTWPFGLAIAVFSSALPNSLEMIALRRMSARAFGTLMSFEPAIAALAGAVVLHEHLSLMQCGAIAAITVASAGAVSGDSSTPSS